MEKHDNIIEIEKMRHEVLAQISEDLNEALIAAAIREPEDIGVEGAPEILTVIFDELGVGNDDAVGEFFFYPIGSNEDVTGFFSCVLTIADDLDEANLPGLYEAISVLNFHMLSGSFGVSKDKKILAYRQCVPYPLSMDKDALLEFVNSVTGNATVVLNQWMDMVLRISEGEGDVEDILEAVNG